MPKLYHQPTGLDYLDLGSGPPLLFFHGWGVSPVCYLPLLQHLAHEYRVIAPYLTSTWKEESSLNYFDAAGNVSLHLIDSLNLKQPLILISHSLGAQIAIRIALNYPTRVKRLVIIDGFVLRLPQSFLATAKHIFINHLKDAFTLSGFKPVLFLFRDFFISFCFHSRALIRQTKACTTALSPTKLSSLQVPTLILWGKQDIVIPPSTAQTIQKLIKSSKLHIFPGSHIWASVNPQSFLNYLKTKI